MGTGGFLPLGAGDTGAETAGGVTGLFNIRALLRKELLLVLRLVAPPLPRELPSVGCSELEGVAIDLLFDEGVSIRMIFAEKGARTRGSRVSFDSIEQV